MKVPPTNINVNVPAPQVTTPSPPTSITSTGQPKNQPPKKIDSPKPSEEVKPVEEKKAKIPRPTARALVEIQGNPRATAVNAARVAKELKPPVNPYPTVQELATVKKAQAMEQAALSEIKEEDHYQGVDRKV